MNKNVVLKLVIGLLKNRNLMMITKLFYFSDTVHLKQVHYILIITFLLNFSSRVNLHFRNQYNIMNLFIPIMTHFKPTKIIDLRRVACVLFGTLKLKFDSQKI